MYLYAFSSDADIQIVLLVLDSMDRLDSKFLNFSSRAGVRGTREDS